MKKTNISYLPIIIYSVLMILFIVSFNLFFIEKQNKNFTLKKQELENNFILQKDVLEKRLEQMDKNIYQQRKLIEKYLYQPFKINFNNIDYNLKYSQEKKAYFLKVESGNEAVIIVFKDNSKYNINNIMGNHKIKRLVYSLLVQDILLSERDFVEWSVFYTPEYFAGVPAIKEKYVDNPSQVFISVNKSLQKLKNNRQNIYQSGWETSIFRDQSDSFFMFSKNLPVKNGNRYSGILTANINLAEINSCINNSVKYITIEK